MLIVWAPADGSVGDKKARRGLSPACFRLVAHAGFEPET